jgi:hypothetical protein
MKRLLWIFAIGMIASLATPVFAQDDDFGGGLFSFDPGFDNPNAGGAARGNRGGDRGGAAAPAPDRLVRLRDMMQKANAPLSKDDETKLNTLLDAEMPPIQLKILKLLDENGLVDELYRGQGQGQGQGGFAGGQGRGGFQRGGQGGQGGQDGAQAGGQAGQGGGFNRGGGNRGGGDGAGQRGAFGGGQGRGGRNGGNALARIVQNDPEGPVATELTKMNDELIGKVVAALQPPQQAVLKKYQNDQIRNRGGFDALKLNMEDAGAPLTPEQIGPIQALYDEQKKAKADLAKESAPAKPEQAKVTAMETQTMTKVLRVLNAAQKKALVEAMAKSK